MHRQLNVAQCRGLFREASINVYGEPTVCSGLPIVNMGTFLLTAGAIEIVCTAAVLENSSSCLFAMLKGYRETHSG